MKALTESSIVGRAIEDIFRPTAAAVAAASRGALTASEVVLVLPPPHTGADLAFECFKLARPWKMNPAAIAREMAAELAPDELVARFDPAGPYLNLRLRRDAVAAAVLRAVAESAEPYGHSQRQQGEVVMMEYVSPNTNKPLHLGHIRNAVIGRAVANLLAAQGARLHRTDIINDRGIHIAKSMIAYRRWGDGETPETTGEKGDHFVGRYYVRFEQELHKERQAWRERQGIDRSALDEMEAKELEARFVAESRLMTEAREVLKRWEAQDEEVRTLWRTMNGWVYAGFDETYRRLGIGFDRHYYESEIYQHGREIILDAVEKGLFERTEDGAIVAPLSRHTRLQDKVVLRSDGTGLYITQDVYLATLKFKEFGLTRSLYCIASEQDFYMKQLFATLRLLGFPWAEQLHHLSYGMVYLPEGKMKSREGKVVDADDLIRKMTELAVDALRERHTELEGAELSSRALKIGLAAMSFHFLVVGRDTETLFDPESSIAFEGKTGPYLQYAHARVASILRKAGSYELPASPVLREDIEWRILFGIMLFPSTVAEAAEEYDPSRLCNYLIELAQTFNTFYHDHPVLAADEPVRSSRLALVSAFRTVVHNGLLLLGIEPLDEM